MVNDFSPTYCTSLLPHVIYVGDFAVIGGDIAVIGADIDGDLKRHVI